MISDYEDDEHFCIKCHVTIAGLENYVQHRKANCSKTMVVPKSPLPSQLLAPEDESFGLKADDFFSSLELQSSNKKVAMPSTSGKAFSGILTRSKTSAVIHASTPSGSATTSQQVRDADVQQSKSGKNAWIGGHQLKELGSGDNQTKLIKAVDNLSRTAYLKKYDVPTNAAIVGSQYENSDEDSDEYDYDDDDDEEEDVPRNHTGGKWMPEWSYTNTPPINHTGGKWRPSKVPPQNHTKGKWKPGSPHELSIPPPNYTRGKWKPANLSLKESPDDLQFPPPGHTKGKWRPSLLAALEDPQRKEDADEPKIKKRIEEIPPFRKSNGSVQYWCNPCNRLLSSKIVYERHLRSELHFKRTLHEAEFDDTATPTAASSTTTTTSAAPATHLNTNRDKEAQRTIRKPVEYWSHTGEPPIENNKEPRKNTAAAAAATLVTECNASVTTTAAASSSVRATTPITMTMAANTPPAGAGRKTKRVRRKIYAKCEVCFARVTAEMMGKHLISHYHCRKGDITRPTARKMVLDNIHAVVLQSPYQCAACKFYCNTHDYFLRHWCSDEHILQLALSGGIVTCSFCSFSCTAEDNNTMYAHLISSEHEEVISAINRSVPIIIRNILPIECGTCQDMFTLNIHLRQHCLENNHVPTTTATDEYQRKKFCEICHRTFNSAIALQRHLKTHNSKMFFCSRCNVEFSTHEEIVKHRTSFHKRKQPSIEKCKYCSNSEVFSSKEELRNHIRTIHVDNSHDCSCCGSKFASAEELHAHVETKTCMLSTGEDIEKKTFKCDQCVFSCLTASSLLFHQAMHAEPLRLKGAKEGHYKCLICDKFFPKSSLMYHIQIHTNEKFYKCTLCDARFARKSNLLWHMKKKKHNGKESVRRPTTVATEKNFLCATCGAKFSNNATLKKHMVVHGGKQFKCEHPDCTHMARTPADLSVHRGTHSTEMSFRCDRCDYRGKSKHQLKRHATIHEYVKKYQCSRCSFTCRFAFHLRRHERIHTGSKPFACPHCEYRCNNLENLRKHVLSTNKHPDKCIYECKFCETDAPFAGNFAKEFRAHLLAEHGDAFGTVREAVGYIAGIYDGVYDAAEDLATADSGWSSPSPSSTSVAAATAGALHKPNKINPTMLTAAAPVDNEASASTLMPPAETTFENKGHHPEEQELFPMYIIASSQDDVVYIDKESWCMVGHSDVEESGALVSFNEESDTEPLFQEHFQ